MGFFSRLFKKTCSKCGKSLKSTPGSTGGSWLGSGSDLLDLIESMASYAFRCRSCGKLSCGECSEAAAKIRGLATKICPSCFAEVDPYRY